MQVVNRLNSVSAAVALLVLPAGVANAQNAVHPGEFVVEAPTLTNLGFHWYLSGDENRNATVGVEYRIAGSERWTQGMPLLRIGDEEVGRDALHVHYVTPHMFAGSILDLEPDTEYECRFTMTDPDGVAGEPVRTVSVRTRAEPRAAEGGRILHVYPPGYRGERLEPSFTGLKHAYYGAGRGDWAMVSERPVQPGDIILMHAGLYRADRLAYVDSLGVPFTGTYELTLKGTADRPIVIRAAGDGEVIFDGGGNHRLFDVTASAHHIFEGLTFRNTDIVFAAGFKGGYGATDLTVRNSRFEEVGSAVWTEYAGSRNFHLVDNVILGRKDRHRLLGWASPGVYGENPLTSYNAIKVYGSGHVIAHNAIAYFHDGIAVSTYGTPEEAEELKAVSIDIYNNDIHLMADDFIEADGGVHNIRVMRNRGVNTAQCGVSAQPVYGGPAYYIRNVLYHVPTGCSLKPNDRPAGVVFYHNTIIAENSSRSTFSNGHFRNNLWLGTDVPERPIAVFPMATAYSTYDYNGYRPNRGGGDQFVWIAPAPGVLRDYSLGARDARGFASLSSFSRASGLERHGIEVDYDVFLDLGPPGPEDRHRIFHAVDLDFRLNPGGRAVDAGVRIPNVNDDQRGRAPDLGAIEAGDRPPVYGPRDRPDPDQPFYR
jgi:hypothetical protein